MLKIGTLCLAMTLFVLPVSAASTPATLKNVVAALEKGYAGLQDVQADFSQKTSISAINREQKGSGEVLLKRPASATAMFRFNYSKPKQQIISNGKQVWFYTPDNKQVMVNSVAAMFAGGNSIALSYLTGLGHVSRDFDIAFATESQDKNGNYHLELTPKKPSPVLIRLQLTVSSEAVAQVQRTGEVKNLFPIISSVIHDAGGNRTRIDYSQARVNKGISDTKFNFKVPAGVNVIKP
ncbi:MAG: outer membrane lipoprotein carrier protein LolA [Desulfuromonadaceae bacterium]|nr:outer membrane lipoprotein carrier protein LolA [Desulfuromonadaceae bacterium]MDD2849662.1 outer membrane lipoprotein carrier protein LolA [Desulfuromonadaceae bacterium]MDD4131666.1 outer membrane lipoprotein carrier protein LolA [Desulfuromonadaceae bacterium]